MYALVLTFDKYKPFAEHMIMCYEELWPDNPFTFRIPYQSEEVKEFFEKLFGDKVEMVKSPSGIVDTMFALSEGLQDSDWVYWCMDDRYPIKIKSDEIEACKNFIMSEQSSGVSGVMFCNNPKIWLPQNRYPKSENIYTAEGQTYIRRTNYTMIWNHQFLRVKVVRDFFNLFPRVMKQAKEMDPIKDRAKLPNDQKLYFLNHNIAVYGESTNRGVMTKNCADSFIQKGINIPENFEISNQVLLKGTNTTWDNQFYLLKHKIKEILR